jgi:hypothetical protein
MRQEPIQEEDIPRRTLELLDLGCTENISASDISTRSHGHGASLSGLYRHVWAADSRVLAPHGGARIRVVHTVLSTRSRQDHTTDGPEEEGGGYSFGECCQRRGAFETEVCAGL